MSRVLVIADVPWVRNEVHAALTGSDLVLIDHADPETVNEAVISNRADIVVSDMQVASMGGMAIVRRVRSAAGMDGMSIPVVLLLDRTADVFLARRAAATGWVQKPFSSRELETTVRAALKGDPFPVPDRFLDGEDATTVPASQLGTAVTVDDGDAEPAT
ncbi:MAG: response regulator [Acidimicrobiia bacterium]|nr:response regulator [Acidimicrobiia bacterium]NNF62939.1 response regulator [Acidimicrobiia bacterium]